LWTIVPSYPWEQTARPPGKAGHYRQSWALYILFLCIWTYLQ
jgi:hypothetical protein